LPPLSETGGFPARDPRLRGRLIGWVVFVGALIAIAYAGRVASGTPEPDLLYQWTTAIGGAVQYAFMLGIAWVIARGLGRDLIALRQPASWKRAAALLAASLGVIWVLSILLGLVLKAGKEQGLVPDGWDAGRAAPFVANFAVVVLVAPFVEELIFRGIGFGLLSAFVGPWPSVVLVGLAFGLAHGLVEGLPVLMLFGTVLAWLRWKTGSIYPGMLVHGIFNGVALILAVTL
jgi:membrane protease YdiL (CAAX protease family)